MSNKLLLSFFIILIGCGNQPISHDTIVGEYKDKNVGTIKAMYRKFFFNEYISIGNSLLLNADSTYTFSNCNSISVGVWKIEADSLILSCSEIKWKTDSLNKVLPALKCGEKGKVYITKDGELVDKFEVDDGNVNQKKMYAAIYLSKLD